MARITSGSFKTSVHPVWAADFGSRDHLIAGGGFVDPTQFSRRDRVQVQSTSPTAVGATTMAIAAAPGALKAGSTLVFGTSSVTLTADVPTGATSIAISAATEAIASGVTGIYTGIGEVFIPSGTLVGRTEAEMLASAPWGPADVAGDHQMFLTMYDVYDARENAEVEFYRPGAQVKENFLPGWSTLATNIKTKIRSLYVCFLGAD